MGRLEFRASGDERAQFRSGTPRRRRREPRSDSRDRAPAGSGIAGSSSGRIDGHAGRRRRPRVLETRVRPADRSQDRDTSRTRPIVTVRRHSAARRARRRCSPPRRGGTIPFVPRLRFQKSFRNSATEAPCFGVSGRWTGRESAACASEKASALAIGGFAGPPRPRRGGDRVRSGGTSRIRHRPARAPPATAVRLSSARSPGGAPPGRRGSRGVAMLVPRRGRPRGQVGGGGVAAVAFLRRARGRSPRVPAGRGFTRRAASQGSRMTLRRPRPAPERRCLVRFRRGWRRATTRRCVRRAGRAPMACSGACGTATPRVSLHSRWIDPARRDAFGPGRAAGVPTRCPLPGRAPAPVHHQRTRPRAPLAGEVAVDDPFSARRPPRGTSERLDLAPKRPVPLWICHDGSRRNLLHRRKLRRSPAAASSCTGRCSGARAAP